MDIIEIKNDNISLLSQFLKNDISYHFRYFNTRNVNIINNHIVTIIGVLNNEPIGYGHIDYENKYWIGICILDKYHGKGYGNIILKYLVDMAKIKGLTTLNLTVDNDNYKAINLYTKFGFKFIGGTEMELNIL